MARLKTAGIAPRNLNSQTTCPTASSGACSTPSKLQSPTRSPRNSRSNVTGSGLPRRLRSKPAAGKSSRTRAGVRSAADRGDTRSPPNPSSRASQPRQFLERDGNPVFRHLAPPLRLPFEKNVPGIPVAPQSKFDSPMGRDAVIHVEPRSIRIDRRNPVRTVQVRIRVRIETEPRTELPFEISRLEIAQDKLQFVRRRITAAGRPERGRLMLGSHFPRIRATVFVVQRKGGPAVTRGQIKNQVHTAPSARKETCSPRASSGESHVLMRHH